MPHHSGLDRVETVAEIAILKIRLGRYNRWEVEVWSERKGRLIEGNIATDRDLVLVILSGWEEFCCIKSLSCSYLIGVDQLRELLSD